MANIYRNRLYFNNDDIDIANESELSQLRSSDFEGIDLDF